LTSPDSWDRALQGVLSRFASELDAMAGRMGLDPSEREALVQEFRIRLWKSSSSPEKLRAVSASFLYKAARWAALDLLRERRRSHQDSEMTMNQAARVPTPDRADGGVERARLGAALQEAVEALAPDRRTVVALWLAGYHRTELPALLGWSEARVRNLLYRGLEDLRTRLREGAAASLIPALIAERPGNLPTEETDA
jgi:RNA polymerase sigma factor (sigma-70 family)